jgi:hypothetical protein
VILFVITSLEYTLKHNILTLVLFEPLPSGHIQYDGVSQKQVLVILPMEIQRITLEFQMKETLKHRKQPRVPRKPCPYLPASAMSKTAIDAGVSGLPHGMDVGDVLIRPHCMTDGVLSYATGM